jgi:hydroxymethylpyrimidine/phosphomethylpyrimidine kinase
LLLYCVLSKNYSKLSHKAVKIGIVPSLAYLQEIVLALKGFRKKNRIVWDTVLKSSTEYDFLNIENQTVLIKY